MPKFCIWKVLIKMFFRNVIIGTALIFSANFAAAATLNSVSAVNGGGGSTGCGTAPSDVVTNSTNTVTATVNDGASNCTLFVEATAGGGLVAARGTLNGSGGSTTANGQASANANSRMTDIYLRPLFDVTDPDEAFNTNFQISVTLNATVDAVMSGVVDASGFGNWQGGAQGIVQGFAEVTGFSSSNNPVSNRANFYANAGASARGGTDADSAILSESLAPTILVDWRIPLGVNFNLNGDVTVNGGFGLPNQTGSFDASNTLSFSKTGPAFIIPNAFTVNAPDLNIFNNRWIDPRTTAPQVVPLPASLPMLLAGLAGLLMIRRNFPNARKQRQMAVSA